MFENTAAYQVTIGLEVHAQLNTKSKLFCSCPTDFGASPNSQTCPTCLGLPGALPVLNKKAVEAAVKLGLATHCKIAERSNFARKNYFYPDLPKGYQITQFENPVCLSGYLEIENGEELKKISIERIHLEEDAGKSIHNEPFVPENETLIDFNRCGIPLLEIVTAPQLTDPKEAVRFVQNLQQLLRYLQISDANLEQGSLRCDANISVRRKSEARLSAKTEIKNLNSLKSLSRALDYEIKRQKQMLSSHETLFSATVLWNEKAQKTEIMRDKEMARDYRYFPEPDLLELKITRDWIEEIQAGMPELPGQKLSRFCHQYRLSRPVAEILTQTPDRANLFEFLAKEIDDPDLTSKWMTQEFIRYENLADWLTNVRWKKDVISILTMLKNKKISWRMAKDIFGQMVQSNKPLDQIIEADQIFGISDEKILREIINKIIDENQDIVSRYRSGEEQLFHYFIGQIMKKTKGRADPALANKLLRSILNSR